MNILVNILRTDILLSLSLPLSLYLRNYVNVESSVGYFILIYRLFYFKQTSTQRDGPILEK